jgi:hypothetical protein
VYSEDRDCYVSKEEYEKDKQRPPFDCGVPRTPLSPPPQMYGHTDMNIDDSAWRMVTSITVITVRCGYCKNRAH